MAGGSLWALAWIPRERRRESYWHEVKRCRFLFMTFLLLCFGDWLGKNVILDPPSKWLGDVMLRTRDDVVPAKVRLIRIDDTDREQLLFGQTPIHGASLVRVLCQLAASDPKVIVVDLDTSSPRSFTPEWTALPQFGRTKVIWGVNAGWQKSAGHLSLRSHAYLGGRINDAQHGIARMPVGLDGVVRGWFDRVAINGGWSPSLIGAATSSVCGNECSSREPSFSVSYRFPEFNLREFVTAPAGSSFPSAGSACESGRIDPRLKDWVVVLGSIHPTEDQHDTPWGTKPGAELVAMALEESLNPHTLGRLPWWAKWMVKVLLALGVAALHHFFWPIVASILTLVMLPVGVLVSSLAAFYFGDYELATIPLIVGILVEQLVTSAEKGDHAARHATT